MSRQPGRCHRHRGVDLALPERKLGPSSDVIDQFHGHTPHAWRERHGSAAIVQGPEVSVAKIADRGGQLEHQARVVPSPRLLYDPHSLFALSSGESEDRSADQFDYRTHQNDRGSCIRRRSGPDHEASRCPTSRFVRARRQVSSMSREIRVGSGDAIVVTIGHPGYLLGAIFLCDGFWNVHRPRILSEARTRIHRAGPGPRRPAVAAKRKCAYPAPGWT